MPVVKTEFVRFELFYGGDDSYYSVLGTDSTVWLVGINISERPAFRAVFSCKML
jgi:hypothetical protein